MGMDVYKARSNRMTLDIDRPFAFKAAWCSNLGYVPVLDSQVPPKPRVAAAVYYFSIRENNRIIHDLTCSCAGQTMPGYCLTNLMIGLDI